MNIYKTIETRMSTKHSYMSMSYFTRSSEKPARSVKGVHDVVAMQTRKTKRKLFFTRIMSDTRSCASTAAQGKKMNN